MLVRMLEHIAGSRDGRPWPPRGGIIELPAEEAHALIAHGYAQPVPPAESPAFAPQSNGEPRGVAEGIEMATIVRTRLSGAPGGDNA
jgi:hypothetical protein